MKSIIPISMCLSILYGCSSDSIPDSDNSNIESATDLSEAGNVFQQELAYGTEFSGLTIEQAYLSSMNTGLESGTSVEPTELIVAEPQIGQGLAEESAGIPPLEAVNSGVTMTASPVGLITPSIETIEVTAAFVEEVQVSAATAETAATSAIIVQEVPAPVIAEAPASLVEEIEKPPAYVDTAEAPVIPFQMVEATTPVGAVTAQIPAASVEEVGTPTAEETTVETSAASVEETVEPADTIETADTVEVTAGPVEVLEPLAAPVATEMANAAPVLRGSPATVISMDQSYLFEPTASDPDGDELTFSIQNKPGWASFDTVSGRLSGIPTAGDVGGFANIVISVTDGKDTSSLSAITITVEVVEEPTGTVTLSWTAPVVRTDGEALSLSEIAGYVVYFGTDLNSFSNTLEIGDASKTTITLSELPVGEKYFFTIATKDRSGLESDHSGIVSKMIVQTP